VGGKRGPLIAGAAVAVILVLVAFFLVLPKMGQVKDANAELESAVTQQSTLASQLAALEQAEADAPKNRETIRKVDQAIPPTVDQQGFILLLQNAAIQSSVDLFTLTPSTPVYDPATGLSTVANTLSVRGSYFALTEFLFSIETLPRAAKVTLVNLTPGEESGSLTLSAGVDIYTSDTSAGPGSSPGPTPGTGTTTTPTTPADTSTPADVTTSEG
jgi:Tfp pilus assembly protein PilO